MTEKEKVKNHEIIKLNIIKILAIIIPILLFLAIILFLNIDDEIYSPVSAKYTEYYENNTYIKEGLEYKKNATRYIVNATIENKRDSSISNVEVEVRFYDINGTHIGSKHKVIPLLPKGYKKEISVNFTRERDYFENVSKVECKIHNIDNEKIDSTLK